jgi:hypothetical protein
MSVILVMKNQKMREVEVKKRLEKEEGLENPKSNTTRRLRGEGPKREINFLCKIA